MRPWPRLLVLAVPILWVAAAHIGPLLAMARISAFAAYPAAPGARPEWTLAAYRAFLLVPGYRASLAHSLILATAATALALLLAYPLAYHVARHTAPARRGRFLILLVAPFWASEILRMFALVLLLSNRGLVNLVLHWSGLAQTPVTLLYGPGSVLAGTLYTVLLTMLLPLYAALDRLPPEVLDAASDLGATPWSRFWHVTLPLTRPGVASGIALTFLASLGVFAAPAILGGPGTPVFATTIAGLFGAASGRWPVGAAFSFILLGAGTACACALAALAPGWRRSRSA